MVLHGRMSRRRPDRTIRVQDGELPLLEHEDRDMMRPFVTMPAELMPFMA
jgi:hypothetical protein